MKRFLKYSVVVALLIAATTSCYKRFSEDIALAVNYTVMPIPVGSDETGADNTCYFEVYSTGSWEISVEPAVHWLSLSPTSGSGYKVITCHYNYNSSGQTRNTTIIVRGTGGEAKGLECRFTAEQSK